MVTIHLPVLQGATATQGPASGEQALRATSSWESLAVLRCGEEERAPPGTACFLPAHMRAGSGCSDLPLREPGGRALCAVLVLQVEVGFPRWCLLRLLGLKICVCSSRAGLKCQGHSLPQGQGPLPPSCPSTQAASQPLSLWGWLLSDGRPMVPEKPAARAQRCILFASPMSSSSMKHLGSSLPDVVCTLGSPTLRGATLCCSDQHTIPLVFLYPFGLLSSFYAFVPVPRL